MVSCNFNGDCICMKKSILFLSLLLFYQNICGQQIVYSESDREDSRQLEFEIIGKFKQRYLIYKNTRSRHSIAVYDSEMKAVQKVSLGFIPDRVLNVDVFHCNTHALLIYQFERKRTVYCMGVLIDTLGNPVGVPQQLDTTLIPTFGDSKIYSVLASDDKQKFMVFKMKNHTKDELEFQTLLLSNQLSLIKRSGFTYSLDHTTESIADFYLDNAGDFLFSHVTRPASRDYIVQAQLVVLPAAEPIYKKIPLQLDRVFLDELRIKVDNINRRYILASLYSKAKRGNIDGMFVAIVSKDSSYAVQEHAYEFSDEFRNKAKGESSQRFAFNDFYLKHFFLKKDGSFLVTGESSYNNSRGNNFNRWDNPWQGASPWGFGGYWGWSPYNNWGWRSPWGWNSYGAPQTVRYYADNVMVAAVDKQGVLQWNSVITKSQFDDNTDQLLSYQCLNTGGEVLFLFNEWNRRTPLLTGYVLQPSGQLTKMPPLRSLDGGYEFLIRFGKQVAVKELIVPCNYRNTLVFARVQF